MPQWSMGPTYEGVSWATLTGQNMEGRNNAFDTTFWEAARRQDEEQATRGMRDRFTRADATGIAVYDDEEQGITFGDVWLNGVKQGNLRQGYGGLSREQGTEMLARMVLPREVVARAYEAEQGRPGAFVSTLDEELESKRAEFTENYKKGLSASEFESRVAERAAGFEESGAAQTANVAAGAAGGALVGAGIGSVIPGVGTAVGAGVGALVGGIGGGIGAWLNRDEQFTLAATAMEQWDLASSRGSTLVGLGDALAGWAGVAAANLSPARNLVHGLYDRAEGEVGDGRSAYWDQDASLAVDALDTAAMLVDGIGSFGSRLALRTYTATMGAAATGATASVVAGWADGTVGFNPYSGQYEELGGWGMLARSGSAAIDWFQTAPGLVLANRVGSAFTGRARGMADVQGGHVIRTAENGERLAARWGLSALIPSEGAVGLSARALARRSLRRQGQELSRENMARETARHIDNLTAGRRGIATMAVNAYGEGAEEFVQAALDAASVGEAPTLRELVQAARQGAAMGAGMGLAVHRTSRSRDAVWRARSDVLRLMNQQEPLTDKEWERLDSQQRAMEGTPRDEAQRVTQEKILAESRALGNKLLSANLPERQRALEVVQRLVEQEARNSQPNVEPSRLSVKSNHDWGPQDYVVSLESALRDVSERVGLLERAASGQLAAEPELVELASRQLEADRALAGELTRAQELVTQAREAGDLAGVQQVVGQVNALLRELWDSTGEGASGRRRAASVWGARFPLNSAGSFQLLRLQVSPELTWQGNTYTVLAPLEIQAQIGGDYDGDRFIHMLREVLPEETYEAARAGAGQLATDAAMIKMQDYVQGSAELLYDALAAEPGSALHRVGTEAVADLKARLHEVLDQSPIPARDVTALVDSVVGKIAARDPKGAWAELFSTLPTRFAVQMRELAATLGGSPWLILNRALEDGLSALGTAVSLTDLNRVTQTGAVDLPAVSRAMPEYTVRPQPASSEMLTGAIRSSSWDQFRLQTILKYNAYREPTRYTAEEQELGVAALAERFAALNDGIVRSGDEAAFEGTLAQERSLEWLTELAREYHADFGTRTVNEALVLMAGAPVPDVDALTQQLRSDGTVNLAQAVLHHVVTGLRREYAELGGRSETEAMRLESLESLTRPDSQEGTHTRARGGTAYVELLGSMRISALLGEDAAHLASYTVRGLRDTLLGLRSDVREEFVATLKDHPQYAQEVDGPGFRATPYRVLVDNVVESARMELSEVNGLAVGERARADRVASESFTTMHDSVRKLAHARNFRMETAEQVREFVAANPQRLGPALLRVMEDRGLHAGMVNRDAEGNITSLQFPTWFYEVLAEPVTARAEMLLLRNTLQMHKASLAQFGDGRIEVDRVSDRILRLWLDLDFRAEDPTNRNRVLDEAARTEFLRLLHESDTAEQFIRALNTDFRFRPERSAPYMAWDRDAATVEPDRFGQGISEVRDGQEMREALAEAAAAAARELQQESAAEEYLATNAALLDQIRSSRDGGGDPVPWAKFKAMFEQVRYLPTLISASLMVEQASRINEILSGMGVKGKAPSNVAAMGAAIAAQLPTYDSALGRLLGSATSGSVNAVLTDMTQLARGERTFVMNDGTVVDWDGLTPERALDLLADPKYAGLMTRMLGLTAWDFNSESGVSSLTSVLGKGVAGFAIDAESELFSQVTAEGRLSGGMGPKLRRLMILEGKATEAGGPPILPVHLATLMNLYETGVDHVISPRSPERQRMATGLLSDIADALQYAASLEGLYQGNTPFFTQVTDEVTGERTTVLNRVLRRVGRRARVESGNIVAQMVPSDGPLRDLALETVRQWIAEHATDAYRDGDRLRLQTTDALKEAYEQIDNWAHPAEVLVDRFKRYEDPEVQRQIVGLLRGWGDVSNTVAWARDEILRALSPTTPRAPGQAGEPSDLPDLTLDQWETLARAVIAFQMHTSYGIATSSEVQISEFPSLKNEEALENQLPFWDPSGVSLVLDILAPGVMSNPSAQPSPLLAAQLDLQRELAPQLPTVPEDAAEAAFYKMVAPVRVDSDRGTRSGRVGQWHALVPSLMHSAVGAVMSSAASSGISMAGRNPGQMRFFGATTERDWSRRPEDTELSATSIPVTDLVAAVNKGATQDVALEVELAVDGQRLPRPGVLAHLQGRIARKVVLVGPDGTEHSLLGHPRFSAGLALPAHLNVPAGEAGAISLPTLAESAVMWLEDAGVPVEQRAGYELRVEYFHPATKTVSATRSGDADYDHSAWFDGVGGHTDAAYTSGSLMGFLYYTLDGAIPAAYDQALGAIKKLHFALQQVTSMPEARRRDLMAMGLTNMSGMLDAFTDFVMRQKIDGEPIEPSNYNAIRKFFELLYVVRYVDEGGVPRVASAETVTGMQLRGQEFAEGSDAQVVGLPIEHVLTLMGERTAAQPVIGQGGAADFMIDLSRARPYTKFPAEAWTEEMFGGLVARDEQGWATTSLLDWAPLHNLELPRTSRLAFERPQVEGQERDYYAAFRTQQRRVHEQRASVPQAGTRWAAQREATKNFDLSAANPVNRLMHSIHAQLEGRHSDGARVLVGDRPTDKASHDYTTGWVYIHHGTKEGSFANGVLTTTDEVADYTALGDRVTVPADTFRNTPDQSSDELFRAARPVLEALTATGASIHIPGSKYEPELATRMRQWLREHDYAPETPGSDLFVPAVHDATTQAEAAYHSLLRSAEARSSANRVLIELTDSSGTHENSIWSVNDGIGALEDVFQREVYQTARYAGYAPPGMRRHEEDLARILLPVLRSEAGVAYLHAQSQPSNAVERRELDEAIQDLVLRLERVQRDRGASLLPTEGEESGTGQFIPLISTNADGEVVGIHLYRHGHVPADEAALRGPVSEENKALGVHGARLTVDAAQVNPDHTAHTGTVVQLKWVGLQGFLAELRVRLSDLGSKIFEVGSGMKWTTAPPPASLRVPRKAVFAGKPVLGVGDKSSSAAKNSDQWWLNSVPRIAETVGFDTTPFLVRAIYGTEYSTDPETYHVHELEVRRALRAFARQHGGTLRPEHAVRRSESLDFQRVLVSHLQDRLNDQLGTAAPNLLEDSSAERVADATMLRLVLTALAAGAPLSQALSAPGYIDAAPGSVSHTMHPVFYTLLEQLPADHPAKAAFVAQVNARLASTREANGDGYYLNADLRSWTRQMTREDGQVESVTTMLAYPPMRNADDNDALSEQGHTRRQRGDLSATTLAMARTTWGAEALVDDTKFKHPEVLNPNPMLHTGNVGGLTFNTGASASPFGARMDDDLPLSAAARDHIETRAIPARKALRVPIDDSGWYEDMPPAKKRREKEKFDQAFDRVMALAKFQAHEKLHLVEMIRSMVARPADVNRAEGEFLTRREAMAALKVLERNFRRQQWPLLDGAINVVSRPALEALRRNGYQLRDGTGKNRPVGPKWSDWVDVMLAEAFTDDPRMRGYPAVSNVIDGLLYEYRKDVKGLLSTGSISPRAAQSLAVASTDSGLLIASPQVRRELDAPSVQAGQQMFSPSDLSTEDTMFEELPQEARSIVEQRMAKWEGERGMSRRRQSPRAEARRGAPVREELARTNMMMRFLQLWYVFKTMLNPGLHVAAYLELAQKSTQERMVSFLDGSNPASILSGQGFTAEQRRLWKDTRATLAKNPQFYGMIFANTNWNPHEGAGGKVEAKLQRIVNYTSAMFNDPTWMQRGDAMAQAFMEAAWDSLQKTDTHITPEQFLDTLGANPEALTQISKDAVDMGYARVEYRRNLQDNLLERSRRHVVEGIIDAAPPGLNSVATILLRFPTMFFRFRTNTLINLMGLQAPHAVLSTLFSDRTKRRGGLKDRLTGQDADLDPEVSDTARIEDSLDLTRAMIRSGVGHTQLLMLASMITSLGWGGEDDEEERLLTKLQRHQQTPVAKDPLALENDFRNAEAWFIDMLPAGMGVPNWALKLFVSPAMGMARFHETGDFRQIYWGFADALGSLPLLNLDNVLNSWQIANELQAAAEAEYIEGNIEALGNASRLAFTAIGTLENMLFESAFASMLYQAADEWDRDPYVVVDRDELGNIRRETAFGTPLPTDALQDIQEGERFGQQGYVRNPSDFDTQLRALAERRPFLAHALALIKQDSTYIRTNMAVKTRKTEAEALTHDEATQLIMSIVNNETGAEELTVDGAEAVVRGIQLGTVRADSPALQGVYIPREMRVEIQDRVLEDLTEKYLDMGFYKSEALSKAKAEFYGQSYGEPEGLGFADILWSDAIPQYPTQRYMQLNTTYVMGPNGRPIATGLQRGVLAAFGVPGFETYHAGQTSNMPVDELLNSVDAVRGINTGMRGLVKMDESWVEPSAAEIGKSIEEAIERIGEKLDDLPDSLGRGAFGSRRGWRNYGRGRYSRGYSRGGGGGGWGGSTYVADYGGQAQRMNAPRRVKSPGSDDLYSINTANPIIRRAAIRRERFSSTRGRLNQWQ